MAGGIVSDAGLPAAVRKSPIALQITSGVQLDIAGLLDRAVTRARR